MRTDLIKSVRILQLSSRGARWGRSAAYDASAQLVDTFIETERLFRVAAIWKDRLGSALVQVIAQLGAVVGLVAEHPFQAIRFAA